MEVQNNKTPGMPNFFIMRPIDNVDKISVRDPKLFWSRNEMLLYLIKHSRPDIANATHELSKVIDSANEAAT